MNELPGGVAPESDAWSDQLHREAESLHQTIFGRPVPIVVAQHYARAHRYYLLDPPSDQVASLHTALSLGLDLEALEFALRLRAPSHLLVRKTQVLLYIAEAFPEYLPCFVYDGPRTKGGVLRVAFHVVRSAYKLIKGSYLLRRHQLA